MHQALVLSRRSALALAAPAALAALAVVGCAARSQPEPHLTDAPPYISVAQWGGQAPSALERARARPHTPTRLTLHHAGVAFGRDKDPVAHMRNLQKWSRGLKNWADIPYHYVIDLDGRVYEARDIALAGDTNTSYDPAGHALVMVLGNFDDAQPTPAQLEATVAVFVDLARRFKIDPLAMGAVSAHKDHASTSCPGAHLYPFVASGELAGRVARVLGR